MIHLSIRLFGDYSAVDFRGNALSIGNTRTQALVIYLALQIGGRTSLSELAELLYGDPDALAAARGVVWNLRSALRFLPADVLVDDGLSVRFNPESVDVDTHRFNQLIGVPSLKSTREATEIYRGNLLERFRTTLPEFDHWIAAQRQAFAQAGLAAFSTLLTAQIRAGWWDDADETARRLLALDPSQEVVHRTLIRLQVEQGRPDAALRRYEECAAILRRDYGRDPDPESQALHREILESLEKTPEPRTVRRASANSPILVLVLEDDLVSSALLCGFLTSAGYEVVGVTDGADVLLELGRRRFDLLVLDINVPTLNGLKVFEIMLEKHIDTPALFITGMAGTEVETQSLEMGAAGFLRKPIRKDVLLSRVRTILESSATRAGTAC
ncbi:MAG TPA: response regulator [Thermoanaerobaculia bacterium]|nr:response regulator [Thermoanaerobaculia bacterium]